MQRWLPTVAMLVVAGMLPVPAAQAQYAPPGVPPVAATQQYIVVTAPAADVLAEPRGGGLVLMKVVKGDLLPLIAQVGDWYSVAADRGTGWIPRGSAALLMHPEFLDPARLREAYTPPPYVPPGAYQYPGWGYRRVPYPWQDPLWWGLWYYDQKHDDDDHDDHHDGHGHGGGGGHDGNGHRDRDRDRSRNPAPSQPVPHIPRTPPLR